MSNPAPLATTTIEQTAAEVGEKITGAVEEALMGDFSGALDLAQQYIIPVGSALIFLIVGYFLAHFLAHTASAPIRKRVDETIGRFIKKLVFYAIMTFVLLGILGRFGISVASFAAVLAAAGFAIGLAFQGTLSNFAAGILLLVFRPFKVGDAVSVAGVVGKVIEIDLFTTTFDTPDNRRIIVPNSSISGATIENITYHQERRVDVNVGVDYSASLEATRSALTQAAESLNQYLVLGEGRGFQVFLGDLGDSAVNWQVRFWTQAANFWTVKEALTAAVKNSLDAAGLNIPFPQIDVHLNPSVPTTTTTVSNKK